MPRNYRIFIFFAIAISTVACSAVRPTPEQINSPHGAAPAVVVPASAPDSVEDSRSAEPLGWWFDYYRKTGEQSAAALAREYQSTEAAYAGDKSLPMRLRMVALLSQRDAPFRNPERAVKLLDDVIADRDHQQQVLRDAAAVIRSRLLTELDDARKIQMLQNQLKDMQTTNREIQNQLNALKEIERSLYERDKPEVINKR